MVTSRWYRLNADWNETPWLADLPYPVRSVWPYLLSHVKLNGVAGVCKRQSARRFALKYDIPPRHVEAFLEAAIMHGSLIVSEQFWTVSTWNEHQTDPKGRQRSQEFRDARKSTLFEPSVTERNGCVTDRNAQTETETETETENYLPTVGRGMQGGAATDLAPHPAEPPQPAEDKAKKSLRQPRPGSSKEAQDYGAEIGLPHSQVARFVDYWESRGWGNKSGQIKDWRAAMRTWHGKWAEGESAKSNGRRGKETVEETYARVQMELSQMELAGA